jgi:hypothetical protein
MAVSASANPAAANNVIDSGIMCRNPTPNITPATKLTANCVVAWVSRSGAIPPAKEARQIANM